MGSARRRALYTKARFEYSYGMIFPMRELIEYKDNMYEITAAASRRSFQLSMLLDEEIKDDFEGKMVALAARQVFLKEIEFALEAE